MSEQEEYPLITPTLLEQLRQKEDNAVYQDIADSLVEWFPQVVRYDIVLKNMMTGNMNIDLRFIQSGSEDLVRLKSLCVNRIDAYLGTLIDLRCYDWNLEWGCAEGRGVPVNMLLVQK